MGNKLDGKRALVTGVGRRIARNITLLMDREGVKILVNDLGGAVDGRGHDEGLTLPETRRG